MWTIFQRKVKEPILPINSTDTQVTQEDIQLKTWKYSGYRTNTRFLGASCSFFITRQFRTLNVRIILALQDQLAEKERDLDDLDGELSRKATDDAHNSSFRNEPSLERLK